MSIPVDGTWALTFDDEFNGTSLDLAKWGNNWLGNPGAITKPVNSEELCAYDPAQVTVSGGMLHLNAIDSPVTVNGVTYQYRSGLVNTHAKFTQAYGYFEARIFSPGSNGQISDWPAFWTDGETWPTDGEMDIMEGLGGQAAYHFHSPSGGPGKTVAGDFTGWHTFGAEWQPGKVTFYYDNTYVGEITTGITDAAMYIILNLGIGIHSLAQGAAEMLVDWVHVYSHDAAAVPVTAQDGYTGPGGTGAPVAGTPSPINGTAAADTLSGTSGADEINGLDGNDTISGLAGDDKLVGGNGSDTVSGGDGNDQLRGGLDGDRLTGGVGADRFCFGSLSASTVKSSDTILDFHHGECDLIVLSGIDANKFAADDQAFDFIGTAGFHKVAGELHYYVKAQAFYVEGDVNGDGRADFVLKVVADTALTAADFIL